MSKDRKNNGCVSTTCAERYYHFNDPILCGTVFFRQEEDTGPWQASVAIVSDSDTFCRRIGRTVARRKYFAGKRTPLQDAPTYETAESILMMGIVNLNKGRHVEESAYD